MNGAADWRDAKYGEILDLETRSLEKRRTIDPSCRVEDLEAVLLNLYSQEGADWGGRGDLQDTVMSATIAAYEAFICAWKAERQAI